MNRFYTSDLHFGHANIIKYCNRPFENADDMNEALVKNWNDKISYEDEVFILGDVFFTSLKVATELMIRLNGKKYLILGNHDKLIRKNHTLYSMFNRVYPDLYSENYDGIFTVMCHFPLLSWERQNYGSFMLHGHTHGGIKFDNKTRRLDVGVDTNNMMPYEWSEIKRKLGNIIHKKDYEA